MSYISTNIIAKKIGCNPQHIEYIRSGSEVEVFSFIDNNGLKKVIKIYSSSISNTKGFKKVKKDSLKIANILKGTSKTLKPLKDSKIKIKNKIYYFQIFNYMDLDLIDICNDRNGIVNLYEMFIIALRIIMGVNSLHKANITHCDIKLDNIMVNLENKKVKLIDFGFAKKILPNQYYKSQGSDKYLAPELKMIKYSNGISGEILFFSDIYSLGVVLYGMFTRNINLTKFYLFKDSKNLALLPYETPEIRMKFFELIEKMLDKDYRKRPNIEEVKKIMVEIFLDIEKEREKNGNIENIKLKNREKLELGILNNLNFEKIELEKIESNTLKRISFLLDDNKINKDLGYNIKKYINEIYCDNTFIIENEEFKKLNFNDNLKFELIRTRLYNTKLAQTYYYLNQKKIEDNKKFLNEINQAIKGFEELKGNSLMLD